MKNKHKLNKYKLLTIISIFVILGLISLVFTVYHRYSSDILYLTPPVVTFSGIIDKIGKDYVTVSNYIEPKSPYVVQDIPPSYINKYLAITPQPPKKITYRVKITTNTIISRPPLNIPYLFQAPSSSPSQISINDIKEGEYVTIMFPRDLRLPNSSEESAISLSLLPIPNVINGKITAIKQNILTVEGSPSPTSPENSSISEIHKIYLVNISDKTEISRYTPPDIRSTNPVEAKKEKFQLKDLAFNMPIVVYTDVDVTTNDHVNALRIEPVTDVPLSGTSQQTTLIP